MVSHDNLVEYARINGRSHIDKTTVAEQRLDTLLHQHSPLVLHVGRVLDEHAHAARLEHSIDLAKHFAPVVHRAQEERVQNGVHAVRLDRAHVLRVVHHQIRDGQVGTGERANRLLVVLPELVRLVQYGDVCILRIEFEILAGAHANLEHIQSCAARSFFPNQSERLCEMLDLHGTNVRVDCFHHEAEYARVVLSHAELERLEERQAKARDIE